jgi:hypothetical protein
MTKSRRLPVRKIRRLLPTAIIVVTGTDLKKPTRIFCYSDLEERQAIDQFGREGRNIDIFTLPRGTQFNRCRMKYHREGRAS